MNEQNENRIGIGSGDPAAWNPEPKPLTPEEMDHMKAVMPQWRLTDFEDVQLTRLIATMDQAWQERDQLKAELVATLWLIKFIVRKERSEG